MIIYLESSAATKLLFDESESRSVRTFLRDFATDRHAIVSSVLLETELRRAAQRGGASQLAATEVLERVDLIDLDRATFAAAGLLPDSALRSLDALHLAAALGVSADVLVSYDSRQIRAAEAAGVRAVSPR